MLSVLVNATSCAHQNKLLTKSWKSNKRVVVKPKKKKTSVGIENPKPHKSIFYPY